MEELLADEVVLLAREGGQRGDLLGDALLLLERQRDRLRASPNVVFGASTAGITTSSPASSRYWTIISAWFRSSSACR